MNSKNFISFNGKEVFLLKKTKHTLRVLGVLSLFLFGATTLKAQQITCSPTECNLIPNFDFETFYNNDDSDDNVCRWDGDFFTSEQSNDHSLSLDNSVGKGEASTDILMGPGAYKVSFDLQSWGAASVEIWLESETESAKRIYMSTITDLPWTSIPAFVVTVNGNYNKFVVKETAGHEMSIDDIVVEPEVCWEESPCSPTECNLIPNFDFETFYNNDDSDDNVCRWDGDFFTSEQSNDHSLSLDNSVGKGEASTDILMGPGAYKVSFDLQSWGAASVEIWLESETESAKRIYMSTITNLPWTSIPAFVVTVNGNYNKFVVKETAGHEMSIDDIVVEPEVCWEESPCSPTECNLIPNFDFETFYNNDDSDDNVCRWDGDFFTSEESNDHSLSLDNSLGKGEASTDILMGPGAYKVSFDLQSWGAASVEIWLESETESAKRIYMSTITDLPWTSIPAFVVTVNGNYNKFVVKETAGHEMSIDDIVVEPEVCWEESPCSPTECNLIPNFDFETFYNNDDSDDNVCRWDGDFFTSEQSDDHSLSLDNSVGKGEASTDILMGPGAYKVSFDLQSWGAASVEIWLESETESAKRIYMSTITDLPWTSIPAFVVTVNGNYNKFVVKETAGHEMSIDDIVVEPEVCWEESPCSPTECNLIPNFDFETFYNNDDSDDNVCRWDGDFFTSEQSDDHSLSLDNSVGKGEASTDILMGPGAYKVSFDLQSWGAASVEIWLESETESAKRIYMSTITDLPWTSIPAFVVTVNGNYNKFVVKETAGHEMSIDDIVVEPEVCWEESPCSPTECNLIPNFDFETFYNNDDSDDNVCRWDGDFFTSEESNDHSLSLDNSLGKGEASTDILMGPGAYKVSFDLQSWGAASVEIWLESETESAKRIYMSTITDLPWTSIPAFVVTVNGNYNKFVVKETAGHEMSIDDIVVELEVCWEESPCSPTECNLIPNFDFETFYNNDDSDDNVCRWDGDFFTSEQSDDHSLSLDNSVGKGEASTDILMGPGKYNLSFDLQTVGPAHVEIWLESNNSKRKIYNNVATDLPWTGISPFKVNVGKGYNKIIVKEIAGGEVSIDNLILEPEKCWNTTGDDVNIKYNGDVVVYPNPARDYVKISFDNPSKKLATCSVLSLSGKIIMQHSNLNNEFVFERGNLISGSYVYQLLVGNESVSGLVIFK